MGPAGAGRPGLDGAGRRRGGRQHRGRRPRRRSQWSGKGAPRAARRGTAAVRWGRGRQPGSATGARRSVRPGLRAPGLERGGGAARGGAGEGRGGGSDPGFSRHRKRSAGGGTYRKCVATPAEGARPAALPAPTGARAKPPAADARSTQPAELGPRRSDRYGTRGLCDFPRGSVGPPSPRTSAETVAVRGA